MKESRVNDIFKSDPRDIKLKEIKTENPEEFQRRTYMIRKKYIDLIDRVAWWDRKEKQLILDEALNQFFKDKKIKPYPKED